MNQNTQAKSLPRFDVSGAVLSILTVFCLGYGVTGLSDHNGFPLLSIASLLAGLSFGLGFVLVEWRRRDSALVDLSLFRQPVFTATLILNFMGRVFSLGLLPFIILWLDGVLSYSPWHIGMVLSCQSVMMAIAARYSGACSKMLGVRYTLTVGMLLSAAGFLLSGHITSDSSWLAILPLLILMGIGSGITFPVLVELTIGSAPRERLGMTSGLINTFLPLGTAAGIAFFAALMGHLMYPGLQAALTHVEPSIHAEALSRLISHPRLDVLQGHPDARDHVMSVWIESLNTAILVAGGLSLLAAAISFYAIRPLALQSLSRSDQTQATEKASA